MKKTKPIKSVGKIKDKYFCHPRINLSNWETENVSPEEIERLRKELIKPENSYDKK